MESAFATVTSQRYFSHHIPDRNHLLTMKFAVILASLITGASAFGTYAYHSCLLVDGLFMLKL